MEKSKTRAQNTKKFGANPDEREETCKADRVILGDGPSCEFSTDCSQTGLNNNILVVGGSGSGKTMSVAEPFFLESYRRSIIATVTKRRIVNKYIPLLRDRGYEIWDLDFVHPDRGTVAYDPLDYIGSYSDITFVARSVVFSNPKKEISNADPYWDQAATSLFAAIIAYVLMTEENANFADCLEMLDNLIFEEASGQIRTNYDRKFEFLEAKDPSNFAVTNFRSFRRLPIKTASCVFGTLNTVVDSVFSPELRTMFRMKKKVDFEHLASNKTALFITSSPVNPALNCFINMFYGHAFKQLFEFGEEQADGRLPVPVHLLADDFATGCPVPLFDQYIAIFREKQISVTLLIQSESQLSSIYGSEAATTIINNTDTLLYMGSNDLATAQNISLRVNRPLEDVLYMKLGNQILFRRGSKPKIGKRYNILENETYKELTSAYEKRVAKAKRLEKGA
ncbi:MAG: type IV secretory system conjugative DNA transfer family protein [Eubacteriales bacterium]|nr:type IV secretory system conjugative DNA transfer family protein [Eubacteriales bacterium]